MGVQKFVFFSIHNCDKHPEVPLMEIKYCTEKFINDSGLNHITIRLCGFMQVMLYIIQNPFLFTLSLIQFNPNSVPYIENVLNIPTI